MNMVSDSIKYIGVGEKITDLQKFDPEEYINALFADFDVKNDTDIINEFVKYCNDGNINSAYELLD